MSSSNSVPVLITWDVDPDSWVSLENRVKALNTVRSMCELRDAPATFYFTADGTDDISDVIMEIYEGGHDIGCHGLTHGMEEDYDTMPSDMQRDYIDRATQKIQQIIQAPVRSFRSPRVKTSAATQRILAESDYWSDSSVCSQRSDLISSNMINTGWLLAPRKPYHPNTKNPYKRGDVNIWEVPISALLLPFITSTMKVLGLAVMKDLFRILYFESKRTGKPIVFLGHPVEMVRKGNINRDWKKQLAKYTKPKYFSPGYIRTYGLHLRSLLYRYDEDTFARLTGDLFSFMKSFPDTRFMTMKEYTRSVLGEIDAH